MRGQSPYGGQGRYGGGRGEPALDRLKVQAANWGGLIVAVLVTPFWIDLTGEWMRHFVETKYYLHDEFATAAMVVYGLLSGTIIWQLSRVSIFFLIAALVAAGARLFTRLQFAM